MLNIDPMLFQPKVIRMSTTSSIGLPGQHIIRTTEYSNSQVMAGTHTRNESNNNVIMSHDMDMGDEYEVHSYNSNDSRKRASIVSDEGDSSSGQPTEWTTDQMCWSGDGDISDSSILERILQQNSTSVMSFESNLSNSTASASFHSQMSDHAESKEELMSSLLSKIKSQNNVEASKILLALSSSVENCIAMRQTGYLPLLVQLLNGPEENANDTYHMQHARRINFEVRERIIQVMHNVVFSQPDDKTGRREARVLRLLEQIRDYCDQLRSLDMETDDNRNGKCMDQQLGPAVAALMKLSFDEDHRYAMCQLGGLHAIAELMQVDHEVHGCTNDQYCITIRRYAGMALTNLTFGDGANKALLCSMKPFMEALVAQLYSPSEDLRQVTASVLRNLSWRADSTSKRMLRDLGAVTTLMKAAMEAEKESTLKSILSALWNLSAHCSSNKADICHVDGALAFLVGTLTYKSKSKTLAIVENGGGILRNVSSHVAIQNDYRVILRKHNCLQILLKHLKSPSLTVVSNACGTLWNLSARNAVDQRALWEMGAVSMLKKLINSKHKMISMGSSAALKNLLSSKPAGVGFGLCVNSDSYMYNADMPSLHVRKQKALSTEIDQNLSETYDNTDSPKTSPSKHDKGNRVRRHMSPSAYGMTAQKMKLQRNELQSRKNEEEKPSADTLLVEEKHNGAFQVTKNTKQALNFRQEQQRMPNETKVNASNVPRCSNDRNQTARMEEGCDSTTRIIPPNSSRFNQKGVCNDETKSFKGLSGDRNVGKNVVPQPQLAFRKDYHNSERQTNSAQRERTLTKEDQCPVADQSTRIPAQISGQSPGGSRIPLPKSFNKSLEPQRSVSVSPVAQRRAIPQRTESLQNTDSKIVDNTVTHPKYAWNASYEKEDNEPEEPINSTKRHSRYDYAQEQMNPPTQLKDGKLYSPQVSKEINQDHRCRNDEDEAKVFKPESLLSNAVMSSIKDFDEVEAPSRCSLNLRTSTNVKLTRNHPILSNIPQRDDEEEEVMLFQPRQLMKEGRINSEARGKTVVFDVDDEEFEIEETLSMLSRSSSVASISSFDQQSEHDDDESLASDISRRANGIESPCELLDSPCNTAPSSPQKMNHFARGISPTGIDTSIDQIEGVQCGADEAFGEDVVDEEGKISAADSFDQSEEGEDHKVAADESVMTYYSVSSDLQMEQQSTASPEKRNVVSFKSFEDESSEDTYVTAASEDAPILSPRKEIFNRDGLSYDKQETITVGRASKSNSLSSISVESLEVISPSERVLSEECLPKMDLHDQSYGARQKTTQLSYQVLRDTLERHPNCTRPYESDRGKSLRSFDVKEYDYESLSENEEKGKEDERKAEKNKLFRILESPVDKKSASSLPIDATDKNTQLTQQGFNAFNTISEVQVSLNMEGNSRKSVKNLDLKQKESIVESNSSHSVSSQLDFLMSHKSQPTPTQIVNQQNSDKTEEVKVANIKIEALRRKLTGSHDTSHQSKVEHFETHDSNSEAVKALELSTNDPEIFDGDKENSCGDSDESMLTSSMLCEAKEIANALLGARVDSTEDMTVSTLSCLSDIDNARPPSVMADLGSLSMTSSLCDEGIKAAVSKECQKLFGKHSNKMQSSAKKSLLRELQIGRMNADCASNDISNGSSDSPENMSLKSSCTSDLLGNMNPPTIMDDMSMATSTGSLSELECDPGKKVIRPHSFNQDSSMSERMNDAAAMAQLYAKELSNITGNCIMAAKTPDGLSHIKVPFSLQNINMADVTEIGCDTIGSDTEMDDDFPCDEEDPGSDTLQAPFQSSLSKEEAGEGSTENLTLTLSEEPPKLRDTSPYQQSFERPNNYHMTADEFRVLQENANMIVNTLKTVQIDDCGDMGGLSSSDMLDDETMSLVSNESDEEFLSPDGTVQTKSGHSNRGFPRNDFQMSPVYNGMIAPPQCNTGSSKLFSRKNSSLPQFSAQKKSIPSGLPPRSKIHRYSCPEAESNDEGNNYFQSGVPLPPKKISGVIATNGEPFENVEDLNTNAPESGVFDSRTFTRKKPTIPRNRIPFVHSTTVNSFPSNPEYQFVKSDLVRSPSANSGLSSLLSSNEVTNSKTAANKISSSWKNSAKPRSKSAVDPNRNGKLRLDSTASSGSNSSISSKEEERNGVQKLQRPPLQSSSPQKTVISTQEGINDEEEAFRSQSIGRPSTLAINSKIGSPRSIRHAAVSQSRPQTVQKPEELLGSKAQQIPTSIVSPTSYQNGILRLQSKGQGSMIPSRRSMIPKPGKFGGVEN